MIKKAGILIQRQQQSSIPIASSVSVSDSLGVYSLSYSYSSPSSVLSANNLPEVDDVTFSGTEESGSVLTIVCTWRKRGQASVGASELAIKRADDVNDLNVVTASTLTNGIDVVVGDNVTTTFSYTILAGDVPKFLYFEFTAKLTGIANTDSLPYLSDYTGQLIFPVIPEDAFTGASVRYEEMTFAGGQDTLLVSAVNRGSWGVVVVPGAYALAAPTHDLANLSLQLTRANAEGFQITRPEFFEGTSVGVVMYLPSGQANTRYIYNTASNKFISVHSGGEVYLGADTIATGLILPEDTWFAFRAYLASTNNSYVQLNKAAKVVVNSLNDTGTGFAGQVSFGTKTNSANTLEGSFRWVGVNNGTSNVPTDVEWDAIVDKYIV